MVGRALPHSFFDKLIETDGSKTGLGSGEVCQGMQTGEVVDSMKRNSSPSHQLFEYSSSSTRTLL